MYGLRRSLPRPVKKAVDSVVLRLRESGLLQRIHRRHIPAPPGDCLDYHQDKGSFKEVSVK